MSHRKRKHRQRSDTHSNQYDLHLQASPSSTRPDHTLFIVAHEADIIRGPQAARLADSLEVGTNVDGQGGSRIGEGLIKWESKVGSSSSRDAEGGDIWVDRYVKNIFIGWMKLEYTPRRRTLGVTPLLRVWFDGTAHEFSYFLSPPTQPTASPRSRFSF
jgi:hypothetical protein